MWGIVKIISCLELHHKFNHQHKPPSVMNSIVNPFAPEAPGEAPLTL